LQQLPRPIGWVNLHRIVNTTSLLGLTFAVFSGKMMHETWLPKGELHHLWYSLHLVSWVIVSSSVLLHVLFTAKAGGRALITSILNWK
jgi:hypothetical protein